MEEPGDAVDKIEGSGGGMDDIHASVRSVLISCGVDDGEQGSSKYEGTFSAWRSVGAAGSSLWYGSGSGKSWTGPMSWTDMGYTISWCSPKSGGSWISGDESNSWTGSGRGSWSAATNIMSSRAGIDTRSARGDMSRSAGTDTRSARGAMSWSAGGKTRSWISDGGGLCVGGHQRGRETRKGAWWDVKSGRIAVEGIDFAQDTQEGGADEYIFICDSDDGVDNKISNDDNEFAPETEVQKAAVVDDNEFVPETEMQDVCVMGENGQEAQTKVGMHSKEKMDFDFAGYSQDEEHEPMGDFEFEMVCAILPRFTETFKKNKKKE